MGNSKVPDTYEVQLENTKGPIDPSKVSRFELPLSPEETSLNSEVKDGYAYNMPYIHRLCPRRA